MHNDSKKRKLFFSLHNASFEIRYVCTLTKDGFYAIRVDTVAGNDLKQYIVKSPKLLIIDGSLDSCTSSIGSQDLFDGSVIAKSFYKFKL